MVISRIRCLYIQCHRRLLCLGPHPDRKLWEGGRGRVHEESAIRHLYFDIKLRLLIYTSNGHVYFVDAVVMATTFV